jgi:hypothetical protein
MDSPPAAPGGALMLPLRLIGSIQPKHEDFSAFPAPPLQPVFPAFFRWFPSFASLLAVPTIGHRRS